MIHFGKISQQEFLANYWQKKPLLIKQAIPNFISPIEPDDLAGLSLEEEFESRLITGAIDNQQWTLTNGPFSESDFLNLPEKDWTLLVQGVDRFIPEVEALINHFDFIPRWRFDDVMISYATQGGSVGPHFDFYDVFLLQGSGRRRWQLSSNNCNIDNYLENVPLRIMNQFTPDQEFDVEPGDVLYVPPKVAHHGMSLSDDCTTLSFGYRSYSAKEMFNATPIDQENNYYLDPVWNACDAPAFIPDSAIQMANRTSEINALDFSKFVTKLDTLDQKILQQFEYEQLELIFNPNATYQLHAVCKIAYTEINNATHYFLNGNLLDVGGIDDNCLKDLCNLRNLSAASNLDLSKLLFDLHLVQEI
ncbi:cupin domain-containing protein [Candidatus Thioglobus sp.]|uniref:cupin domain-containing protein n=1 Tax=Candidatus Thioglobus sp. TaxID=2026721 RepID=UPI00261ABEBE|nr:cupin domain-containing protein [Candidatus Thioglobus sp.]MDG2394714.1 cupin domain-containing protein [Candidatus Thioglobus sp.]